MAITTDRLLWQKGAVQVMPRRLLRGRITLWILLVLLVAAVLAGIGMGAVPITPTQLVAMVLERLGISHGLLVDFGRREMAVFFTIRLPRVILGVLVGAGLGMSGAAIQGMFRNPLAAPGLIGISSGAALAAVTVIVLGATVLEGLSAVLGRYTLPLAAFGGGVVTTFVIYRLSTINGRTQVSTMLLAGIAINALAGAAIGFMTFMATDEQLRSITFWNLGSLGGATWRSVSMAAPLMALPLLTLPLLARPLNALLLGEAEAGHLGINVEMTKRLTVLLVALAVGAAVSVTGTIGFIGLVVPHLLRLLVGPDHRIVLPGSALSGAVLLLLADLLARTVAVPAEVPIGILTAVLGGPFFLWLLLKQRHQVAF
jgi:iron complex transport system permease protein